MFRQISILLFLCLIGFCGGVAEAQAQADRTLLIVSKPRAYYTDEARRDNIQGLVRVKVTFLADGTIGKVSDVRENNENLRKSGLVKSAMEAAKRIKFQPAVENGKPVKTTKIMEYRFTLY